MLDKNVLGFRRVDPGVGDDGVGHAMPVADLGQPARLGELHAAVAFGLDMHGGDDVVQRCVAPILLGQVGPAQRRVVTHVGMMRIGLPQPRISEATFQVPEMVVGVDDRQVVVHGHVLL